ncbi:hypothetical protein BU14_0327s0009 [Porphyra umbilicalis]|uniref:Uncharacterized protein n=1 Tax=Porphyra umbilicalis TaxID=2786 RepID=A0A1X6NYX1_PORUM|nr:hypothetical protein BU14_0327s0009 [Porphyra umbilicalis]|eukprot:OSX73798.1 hypothetical protein BU14_0327s0009 [Porphyra umbilicalis]
MVACCSCSFICFITPPGLIFSSLRSLHEEDALFPKSVGCKAVTVLWVCGGRVAGRYLNSHDGAAKLAMTHPALSGSRVAAQLHTHRALHLMLLHLTYVYENVPLAFWVAFRPEWSPSAA